MKPSRLFLLLAALSIANGAIPVKAATNPKSKPAAKLQVPLAAREQMVKGGKSQYFAVLPLGPNRSRALLHVWSVARGKAPVGAAPGTSGHSLFCVDIFLPSDNHWELAATTAFSGENSLFMPQVSTRWLRPKQKEGIVVVINDSHPPGATEILVTFPDGVKNGELSAVNSGYVQHFFSGNIGGASVILAYDGVDARGFMTVKKTLIRHANVPQVNTVFEWNGGRFAASAPSQSR